MKPHTAFASGLVLGALVVGLTLKFLAGREQPPSAPELQIYDLKQTLATATEAAKRDQAALRSAQDELRALRERAATPLPKPDADAIARTPSPSSPSNSAILGYLGDPIPPPANIDPKYSAAALASTFRALCESRGAKIEKLGVDTSEFPFVVHGVVENGQELFQKLREELGAIPGYTYAGSVTGGTPGGRTFFSLNMTPGKTIPREYQEPVNRRLMLRLQMIAAAWSDPER